MFSPRILVLSILFAAFPVSAASLRISANSTVRGVGDAEVEANYTTTHLFVDEIAGDAIPITIFFDPQVMNVESAEVFTNLNRRDRAALDANGDLIEDGILGPNGDGIAPGNDNHYYKAYAMNLVSGGYQITLYATKTGAYRLTARFRFNGQTPGTYHWYNSYNGWRRDHALVISPVDARDIRLYEVNVLNIEANGTGFANRSTFEDLSDRPGAIHTAGGRPNQWNLSYVSGLGINWLWFQPYHPFGWEGRHLSAKNINDRDPSQTASTWVWNLGSPYEDVNYPYALGSPYAVKNFWEIEPRMSASFSGNPADLGDVSSQANRDAAMASFGNFVADADAAGIHLMPDAAFNHTAWDVELGEPGIETSGTNPNVSWMAAQGASGWSKRDLIHDRELRVFSRAGDHRLRATYYTSFFYNNIAPAPDRTDFGKWLDVCDIFFGRYAALVGAQDGSEAGNYNSEGDWIDQTPAEWNGTTGGSFDAFTRATWRYFARYAPYWLEKTRPPGQNRNSVPADGDEAVRRAWDARGIDGLRCDFGQGLPPQAWEYIINVARSSKWNFVFMAETLDDGPPSRRSNRQFDILNERIFSSLRSASNYWDFRAAFDARRNELGMGLVLLNTVSHDEDNFANPWDAVVRYAVSATQDGVPMIFPGQELGIETMYGYDLMEKNFGKFIPHFKTYNSMMPLWSNTDFGKDQLYHVYSAINAARAASPALRSSNRYYLNGSGNNPKVFGVAKYETPGASPATSDVVLGFANLDQANDQADTFPVSGTVASLLGLKAGRQYNVKNIAAYTGIHGYRRDIWQWRTNYGDPFSAPAPRSGADITANGIYVGLKKVPAPNSGAWGANPYEAQYLKLFDVTAPSATPSQPAGPHAYPYEVGESVTFTWAAVAPDAEGVVPSYRVSVVINGGTTHFFTSGTTYTVSASPGDTVSVSVRAVNPSDNTQQGPPSAASAPIAMLDAAGDEDGDGAKNGSERVAGTNPFDMASLFRILETASPAAGQVSVRWASVPGKSYQVESAPQITGPWTPLGPVHTALAGQFEKTYVDPAVSGDRKFFRVTVVP